MREASQRSVGGHMPTRRALVVAEVSLALMLLVGAGLLVRSMRRLVAIPPGFDPSHVAAMKVQSSPGRFTTPGAVYRFFDRALDAVRDVPGVTTARSGRHAWTP
jgi:putative ABC transport system permease protein